MSEPLTPIRLLAFAVAAGIQAGLVEAAPVIVLPILYGFPVRMSVHVPWMAPLTDAGIFLVVGAVLVVVGARWPVLRSTAVAVGVFTGLGALALLLVVEAVADWAMILLAAGIGVQAARWAGRRPLRWAPRVLPPAAPVLLLGVAALAFGMLAREDAKEVQRLGTLPSADQGTPNILLLILDTVRATSMSLYGNPRGTSPELERLAARAVVFDDAIVPSPWTLPTHASLFTGLWPHELRAGWLAPLEVGPPTLAEVLGRGGYATAGFVANLLNAAHPSGLDRGFARYEGYSASFGEALLSSSLVRALAYNTTFRRWIGWHELLNRKPAPDVNRAFFAWLDRAPFAERPWFAFLNYFDAHEPYRPPDSLLMGRSWNRFEHRGGIPVGGNAWLARKWEMSNEEQALHLLAYEAAVGRVDEAAGDLVRELERRGLLENTVVVITSDHGEQLGERGLFEHNNSLYLPALHVPLMVFGPGIPGGIRLSETVSLRDLGATLLEIAGIEGGLPGRSITSQWDTVGAAPSLPSPALANLTRGNVEQPGTPISRVGTPAMHAIVDPIWHYIHNGDGTDELYDRRADPRLPRNLAGTAADSALIRLREILYTRVTGDSVPADMPIHPAEGMGAGG